MSINAVIRPLTARAVLFPDDGPGETGGLSSALDATGVARAGLARVARIPAAALGTVESEVGTVAGDLLDLDIGDAVVLGWRRYTALTAAAARTLAARGTEEVVALATHRVSSTYTPSVDVLVDEVKVNTLEFALSLQFEIRGLSAVVRGGDLVALRGGDCLLTARLTLEGAQLAHKERPVDLSVVVPLTSPIALVDKPVPDGSEAGPTGEVPAQRAEEERLGPPVGSGSTGTQEAWEA